MSQKELAPTPTIPVFTYGILLIIIASAAVGPIIIRQAQLEGVPSLYIITARLFLTSAILTPFILRQDNKQLKSLDGRSWGLITLSGLVFVINLLMLFIALEYTSVLVTSVMRRTSPLWVISLEIFFLSAIFTRRVWLGLLLTIIGSALVGFGSSSAIEAGSNPILGMGLALIGSISIGLYLLIGRAVRDKLPSLTYSWLIFIIAGVLSFVAMLITNVPFSGYTTAGYFWVILVTISSQFLGHIPINIGLRYFPATYMSIIMQLGVVGSAILALLFFNEIPSNMQIIGSIIIMLGVSLVSWKKRKSD